MKKFFKLMKNPINNFLHWYVKNYYSKEFVHISMISEEIRKRIETSVERNNIIKNREFQERFEAEKLKNKIIEDGYIAEIMHLEKTVEEAQKLRTRVEDLYYKTVRRAKDVSIAIAENRHEVTRIINDLPASLGKFDKLVIDAEQRNKEILENQKKDEEALTLW